MQLIGHLISLTRSNVYSEDELFLDHENTELEFSQSGPRICFLLMASDGEYGEHCFLVLCPIEDSRNRYARFGFFRRKCERFSPPEETRTELVKRLLKDWVVEVSEGAELFIV